MADAAPSAAGASLQAALGGSKWAALVAKRVRLDGADTGNASLVRFFGAGVEVADLDASALQEAFLNEVQAVNTYTSDYIRVFEPRDRAAVEVDLPSPSVIVQERDIETKRLVWRAVASPKVAEILIEDRKSAYALMWGSCCGGRIDYAAPFNETTLISSL